MLRSVTSDFAETETGSERLRFISLFDHKINNLAQALPQKIAYLEIIDILLSSKYALTSSFLFISVCSGIFFNHKPTSSFLFLFSFIYFLKY